MLADNAAHTSHLAFLGRHSLGIYPTSPRSIHVFVWIHTQKLEQESLILCICLYFRNPPSAFCAKVLAMTYSSEEPERGSPEMDLEKAQPTTSLNNEAVEDEYPKWQKVR